MYSNHLNAIIFILLFSHIKKAQIAVGSSQKKLHSSLKCESRTHTNRLQQSPSSRLHDGGGRTTSLTRIFLKKSSNICHPFKNKMIYIKNNDMIGAIYSILTLKLTLKYYIYKARIKCRINL